MNHSILTAIVAASTLVISAPIHAETIKESEARAKQVILSLAKDPSSVKWQKISISENKHHACLEHIAANTGNKMASLQNDEAVRLVLFNINNLKDLHWVFALEVYFEQNLQPVVRSARLG